MKRKKLLNWPKEIYIFWIVEFLLGIDLIGAVLLIFFKDWGGLSQTQTQMLQSWFMLWIFILEIPTGVFGDIKGKKFSVMIGYSLAILGTFVYSITPNIWLFALAEFIFALGIAFVSGAKEAWMYDISKKLKVEDQFRDISVVNSNLYMLGMIVAALIFAPISRILPVHQIFRLGILSNGLALILLGFLIPSTDEKKGESLKPDYIATAKKGFNILKENIQLRRIMVYISTLAATSYFVIWLYQEALTVMNVSQDMFGIYRIVLLIAEIIMIRIGAYLLKKCDKKSIYIGIAIIVALGFLLAALMPNITGILFLLIFAGGLGLQVPRLFSKEINEQIEDDNQRATVLSFISMSRRLVLAAFNPFIGYIVDIKGVYIAFAILGVISLLAILFKPKFKLK